MRSIAPVGMRGVDDILATEPRRIADVAGPVSAQFTDLRSPGASKDVPGFSAANPASAAGPALAASAGTVVAPVSGLGPIRMSRPGSAATGRWNGVSIPGGAGNRGDFCPSIPESSKHPEEEFELLEFQYTHDRSTSRQGVTNAPITIGSQGRVPVLRRQSTVRQITSAAAGQ